MLIFWTLGKGQTKTDLPTGSIKPDTAAVITSYGPKSITRNIIQDRNGNIWIASFQGIFRYDGKYFTNITGKVSSARFFSILEDRKGSFWFGTIGAGVYHYDGKNFQNFTTRDGLVNNEIGCIYQDKAGNIWFGANGGVSCYDGKSLPTRQAGFRNYMMNGDFMTEVKPGKTFPDFTRPPNEVTCIIEDNTGRLWFATRGKTFVYDGTTFTVFTHDGIPFTNVRTITEDKKGNIWLCGSDGLWRYDGSTFTNFTQQFVGYVIEDKKGNIWTSSESDGGQGWALLRYDEKSLTGKTPTVTKITNEQMIFGILEDTQGNIWFGASGVYRYDGNTITDFKDK